MQQRRLRLAALLLAGSVAAALVVGSLHMQVRPRSVLCDQRLPGARERAGSAARRMSACTATPRARGVRGGA